LISQNYLQGMMSGLSPNALCRIFKFQYDSKLKVSFDAIKNLTMLLTTTKGTVCTKPLRMYSFPAQLIVSNADLTLWIFKEQPIIEINQLTQSILEKMLCNNDVFAT